MGPLLRPAPSDRRPRLAAARPAPPIGARYGRFWGTMILRAFSARIPARALGWRCPQLIFGEFVHTATLRIAAVLSALALVGVVPLGAAVPATGAALADEAHAASLRRRVDLPVPVARIVPRRGEG